MNVSFFGFEVARKALMANQKALDVTAHNIANANTPGYSRQEAVMETTEPFTMPSLSFLMAAGQMGTGVQIQEVRRVRDNFVDLQFRSENSTLGFWDAKKDCLQKLEVVFNEISNSGLRTAFSLFWESLQELSIHPDSTAVRATVRQRAITLAESFNHLDRQFSDLRADLNNTVEIKATEINSIAKQISDLNDQIVKVEITSNNANDLRDKRDLLLDQLSTLVNTSVMEEPDGSVRVSVGGKALVAGNEITEVVAVDNPLNSGYVDLQWTDDNSLVSLGQGLVQGYVDMRDTDIVNYKGYIDSFAQNLITEINTIHRTGFDLNGTTLRDFFTGTDAETMTVDAAIMADVAAIATASAAGQKGDGSIALQMAQLKQKLVMNGSTSTFDDYYRGIISELGVSAQEASNMADGQDFLIEQLDNRRQMGSGVSLDEEMANMIKFQHSYNAAARVITTMDEMLDTIINRMGA